MISLIVIAVCFLFQCVSLYFGLVCVRWSVYVCVFTLDCNKIFE